MENGDDGALDAWMIGEGMAKVKAAISACGDASKAGGTVKAQVKVGADGRVTSATADGSSDAALNACVANAIKTATFAKTKKGGAFSWPFVFGPSDPSISKSPAAVTLADTSGGLDRSMISDGIAKVKAAISACGDGKTKGIVKIKVVVA